MPGKFFLSASGADLVGAFPGERVLWSGRCAVAEYAFDQPASLPRWTLPEQTEVVVTDTRVKYLDPAGKSGGELHWPWPQHLRVQPGNRDTGRSATVTQIQLVCAGPDGAFPALVFAGGDLATVADADRLANVLRQAITRYRVENTAELGLTLPQSRMLSRLVIGPEFSNYQGGEGQTVSLLGAVPVALPSTEAPFLDEHFAAAPYAPEQAAPPHHAAGPFAPEQTAPPYPAGPHAAATLGPDAYGPPDSWATSPTPDRYTASPADPYAASLADRYAASLADANAVPATDPHAASAADPYAVPATDPYPVSAAGSFTSWGADPPDLAARAADLAARVANLVSGGAALDASPAGYETRTTNLSAFLGPADPYAAGALGPADPYADHYDAGDDANRAETIRRAAARLAGNSGRTRGATPRRSEDDLGAPSRHPRNLL